MSLIVKIILLELASTFSVPLEAKTQCSTHLSFKLTLQLINGISSNLQNDIDTLMTQQFLHFLSFHSLYLQLCFLVSYYLEPNLLGTSPKSYLKVLTSGIYGVPSWDFQVTNGKIV